MNRTVEEIIETLTSLGDEKRKANLVKLGIPEETSLGVSTGDIRKLAKTIKENQELAEELWRTGIHEAKLLAVLLFSKKNISSKNTENLMVDVYSWDLCDHLCKNYLVYSDADVVRNLIDNWVQMEELYKKRAAFTLIASKVIRDKSLSEEDADRYISYIHQFSQDNRTYVKKAVSWALREIGKIDLNFQEQAITVAHELIESDDPSQKWIGKDALKELETLVQVEGRKRLISSKSAMGKQ